MTYDAFFEKATGHLPYDYQRRLACGDRTEHETVSSWLSHGCPAESRLISIPTGLGKTSAVVLPCRTATAMPFPIALRDFHILNKALLKEAETALL